MAFPKTPGTSIDNLFKMRVQRLAAEKLVEKMKADELELRQHIFGLLKKSKLEKASGKLATFTRKTVSIPTVTDWDAFYSWIAYNDAFDCLHRRVTTTAVLDRVENDEKPSGIRIDSAVSFSLTKVGK